jgi:hypothetical protein
LEKASQLDSAIDEWRRARKQGNKKREGCERGIECSRVANNANGGKVSELDKGING